MIAFYLRYPRSHKDYALKFDPACEQMATVMAQFALDLNKAPDDMQVKKVNAYETDFAYRDLPDLVKALTSPEAKEFGDLSSVAIYKDVPTDRKLTKIMKGHYLSLTLGNWTLVKPDLPIQVLSPGEERPDDIITPPSDPDIAVLRNLAFANASGIKVNAKIVPPEEGNKSVKKMLADNFITNLQTDSNKVNFIAESIRDFNEKGPIYQLTFGDKSNLLTWISEIVKF